MKLRRRMRPAELLELAVWWVGLVTAALFLFTFGPSVYKAGQLIGWW